MLTIIFWIRPAAFSYFGFTLLFKLSTPLVFASLSQMLIIMLGDIDLSNGSVVGLINCVTAVYLQGSPVVAILIYLATIAGYAAFGLLIYLRRLPGIVMVFRYPKNNPEKCPRSVQACSPAKNAEVS